MVFASFSSRLSGICDVMVFIFPIDFPVVTIKKNISGDKYYGFTPDWENYLKMSTYCADSLPKNSCVLCRKPAMSFIYGHGKKFIGEYTSPTRPPDADSVLMRWKKNNVKYIMLASLRITLKKNNGYIINNIHRMLQPVIEKYPQKLRLLKTIGSNEQCDLYELTY